MKDVDRVIAEMAYGETGTRTLAVGVYRGFQYTVLNVRGMHPCGYVNVSGYERELAEEDDTGHDIFRYRWIDCHGGITYARVGVWKFAGGYWLGWDYGHLGDYTVFPRGEGSFCGMPYFVKDVVYECKRVIDQIVERLRSRGIKLETADAIAAHNRVARAVRAAKEMWEECRKEQER